MVNWRLNKIATQAEIDAAYAIERLRWRNHADIIAKQKEAELMASKKRPPLAWDGEKPLPFVWAIYFDGFYGNHVMGDKVSWYDIPRRVFVYINPSDATRFITVTGSFLVKRLS